MRIYISGAITDNPHYREDFARGTAKLREKYPDAQIVNPVGLAGVFPGGTWGQYMAICETMLAMCDAIYLLRGWSKSEGARWEHDYARRMEMEIYTEEVRE